MADTWWMVGLGHGYLGATRWRPDVPLGALLWLVVGVIAPLPSVSDGAQIQTCNQKGEGIGGVVRRMKKLVMHRGWQ